MEEKVVLIAHEHEGIACTECVKPLKTGEQAIFCPRCKSPHHPTCWINHGGCARKGCRQLVSRTLLPQKEETPIRAKKTPAWVYAAVGVLVVALAVGIFYNARRSAIERAHTIAVMLPASVDRAQWESLTEQYALTLQAEGKELLLTFVPEIMPVMEGQTYEGGYYEQKLLVQMAAKDAPELVLIPAHRLPMYVSQGALAPIDAEVAGIVKPIVDPTRLSEAEIDGHIYGIPHPTLGGFLAIPSTADHQVEAMALLEFVTQQLVEAEGDDVD